MAKACGLTIADLCREARVDRATWQRWKAGTHQPLLSKWTSVEAVIECHQTASLSAHG